VLVSGRPLDIAAQLPNWNALIAAWLPGTEGNGVADVLFGDYAPTGKLPMTWPSSSSQEPINDGDGQTPLFPLGYGLTYPGGGTTTPPPTTTTPPPTTTGPGSGGCAADYSVTSTWQGGFQAAVTVTNRGSAPISAWSVSWTWPSGQAITNLWNATYTQSGASVTVHNASWNGAVAPGTSVTFGLTGTGNAVVPTATCS